MDINEKIREFIIYKDLQPSKLADELGISRPMMSHVLSGRNKPNMEIIMKILSKYPDLNPEWLNGNAPNMFREGASQESYLQENRRENKQESKQETKNITPVVYTTIQPNNTQNLFQNLQNNQQEIEEEKAKFVEKYQETNENQQKKSKKSEGKTIEKIIVFYTDKSFDTYLN